MLAYAVQDGTGRQRADPRLSGGRQDRDRAEADADRRLLRATATSPRSSGFLPAADPRVVIAAILDEPATVYGGIAAAPLFQQVARYAIQRLGIAPAPPRRAPAPRAGPPDDRRHRERGRG